MTEWIDFVIENEDMGWWISHQIEEIGDCKTVSNDQLKKAFENEDDVLEGMLGMICRYDDH